MSMGTRKNPVEQRLEKLAHEWNRLAREESVGLVRWLVPSDGIKLLEVFFELQRQGWEQASPDLFLNFDLPFRTAERYGFDLGRMLVRLYDANRESLTKEGVLCNWQPPPNRFQTGTELFLAYLDSFRRHHVVYFDYLVPVLMPSALSDFPAYGAWLEEVLILGVPKKVRLCIVDTIDAPRFAALGVKFPGAVRDLETEINMDAVVREIVAQAGGKGPGAAFRRLFIDLTGLVATFDPDKLKKKATAALVIARKENWFDQQVVVYMVGAAAYFKAKRTQDAIACYRAARTAAESACKQDHPAGRKLVTQALFGEAAVLFADERFAEAAEVYDKAAEWARSIPDPVLTIDGLRMSAYCAERLGTTAEAWARGWRVLDEGQNVKPEQRKFTTLLFAAEGLMRLAQSGHAAGTLTASASQNQPVGSGMQTPEQQLRAIRERMVGLMGENWDAGLAGAPPPKTGTAA
jgi:hypothetical protein